ncbi:2Fe-2S ferredoxin-type domain-containing protein [Lineolata rhizophorae]|uniref:2Fe-2S ferredoxin-type domain-containing protein n=1 Tax=Lineolata rhizophorae TaxID=578093 RepID=A0A6A6NWB1_9PEZI|nr:2Fe-2S ferredoxin-type domain-containing protein [Lineolata rhizophorae]
MALQFPVARSALSTSAPRFSAVISVRQTQHLRSYSRTTQRRNCDRWSSSSSRVQCAQRVSWPRWVVSGNLATRRTFSSTSVARHGHLGTPKPGEERKVIFIDKEGERHTFEVADGDNLLDIAQANDLEMEGACGGSCACSTCHVIVEDQDYYDRMEEPSDDENDMLDLAFALTETSRLGCQVKMSKELDGLVVKLPPATRNLQASDFADKKK